MYLRYLGSSEIISAIISCAPLMASSCDVTSSVIYFEASSTKSILEVPSSIHLAKGSKPLRFASVALVFSFS